MKEVIRNLDSTLCDACPARTQRRTEVMLRGSSFRGRLIGEDEDFNVDNCLIFVEAVLVANLRVANTSPASAEHDADFVMAVFEENLPNCKGPTHELTDEGLIPFCTPVNTAIEEFQKVNY